MHRGFQNRVFQKGYLDIDFPVEPFRSVPRLLLQSGRIFFGNLGFLTAATLVVFLPVKLAIQFACRILDVSSTGVAMYFLLDASDLALASLVTPAVIFRLLLAFRGETPPTLAESLRWGRRQWGRTLWNKFKAEITITLWCALLIVPGLVKMVQLAFTDPVVAIEADREPFPLDRSRDISAGHGWRIFIVLLPLMLLELVGSYLVLGSFHGPTGTPVVVATIDSLLSVAGQWGNIVILLMYLGLAAPESKAPEGEKKAAGRSPRAART